MNIKKFLVLIVSGSVALVLAAVIGFFLSRYIARYRGIMTDLQAEVSHLNQLTRQPHFPNMENVKTAEHNLEVVQAAFTNILVALSTDTYEPPEIEQAQFPLLLTETIRQLNQLSTTNNCLLPDRFAYGFDRYIQGLPKKGDIPRLARQLYYVQHLCSVLFEHRITKLVSVERALFEAVAPGEGGRDAFPPPMSRRAMEQGAGPAVEEASAAPEADARGLYAKEPIVLTFHVREHDLYKTLNALSTSDLFCAVRTIELRNPSPVAGISKGADSALPDRGSGAGVAFDRLPGGSIPGGSLPPLPGQDPGGGATTNAPPPSREQRVVAGRNEMIIARVEVVVYQFTKPAVGVAEESKP